MLSSAAQLTVACLFAAVPQSLCIVSLQALAAGELTETPSSTGAVADAGGDAGAVAVAAAAAAMASEGPHQVPLQLLLEGGALQWLLGHDAAASLVVLEARRDLPADVVLQLLQGMRQCTNIRGLLFCLGLARLFNSSAGLLACA